MLATSQVATRSDILQLEKRITGVEKGLEKHMAEMEARLVKTFHAALFGFTGVIAACIAIAVAILK